jgi:hypothetical protein
VTYAYPFAGRPTGHTVEVGGQALDSLCAVDALGTGAIWELRFREPLRLDHSRYGRLALSQGAGLVDDEGVDLLHALQRLGILDQYAFLSRGFMLHRVRSRGGRRVL